MCPQPSVTEDIIGQKESLSVLYALCMGRYVTLKELADMTGVRTANITRVLQGLHRQECLLILEQRGRNYFQLEEHYRETMKQYFARCDDEYRPAVSPLKMSGLGVVFQKRRTCYGHMAGTLGVRVTDAFLSKGYLYDNGQTFDVTQTGALFFATFGIDVEALRTSGRVLTKKCLDRSERRFHLGGALGQAWADALLAYEWLQQKNDHRVIEVTDKGRQQLLSYLSLDHVAD